MERITRLKVQSFKSLVDIDIELEPLTVFVGLNGSGKSNVLDALQFVSDAVRENLDYAVLSKRQGMSAIRTWSPKGRPFDVTIEITALVGGPDKREEVCYRLTIGSKKLGEYAVRRETLQIGGAAQVDLRKPSMIPATTLGLAYIHPDLRDVQLRLYRFLASSLLYSIFPDNLREPQRSAPDRQLQPDGLNLASVIRRLRKDDADSLVRIREQLSVLVPGTEDVTAHQVGGFLATRLQHAGHPDVRKPTFDLGMESDGTIRLLAILVALHGSRRLGYIALEEPEVAVHPGAVRTLGQVLADLSHRQQVLVTTHSPDLLDEVDVNCLRLVAMKDGRTLVRRVPEDQVQLVKDKLCTPGELLRAGQLVGQASLFEETLAG